MGARPFKSTAIRVHWNPVPNNVREKVNVYKHGKSFLFLYILPDPWKADWPPYQVLEAGPEGGGGLTVRVVQDHQERGPDHRSPAQYLLLCQGYGLQLCR